jgi:DNA-directed RNA polymerase specialized sigma24 family protein
MAMSAADWLARVTPALRSYVANRVPAQDCDDVVQDILAGLTRANVVGLAEEEQRKLGFTVARRRVADYWRRRSRMPIPAVVDPAVPEVALDDRVHHRRVLQELLALARTLSDEELATLRSIQEAAGPVSPRDRKARERLRATLRARLADAIGQDPFGRKLEEPE